PVDELLLMICKLQGKRDFFDTGGFCLHWDDKHGTSCFADDIDGGGSDQNFLDPTNPVHAHDDEVGLSFVRDSCYIDCRIPFEDLKIHLNLLGLIFFDVVSKTLFALLEYPF